MTEGLREPKGQGSWIERGLLVLSLAFIVSGAGWLAWDSWAQRKDAIEVVVLESAEGPGAARDWLKSPFSPDWLETVRLRSSQGVDLRLGVVGYRDSKGEPGQAIIYPPSAASLTRDATLRMGLWNDLGQVIGRNTKPDALFLSWWDNAQRIHFLTGRETSARLPAQSAYRQSPLHGFWNQAAGGNLQDEGPARQMARWLTMDAEAALREIRDFLPANRDVYWVVCVDDLARLGEVETLAKAHFPLEIRYFPATPDIHTQIAEVRRWASESVGPSNYLVQQVPGGGIKAWRITSEAASKTLLVRLLPFTRSLENPIPGTRLTYQSTWGAYLSVHQISENRP